MSRFVNAALVKRSWGPDRVAGWAATRARALALDSGETALDEAIAAAESRAVGILTVRYADADLPSDFEGTPPGLRAAVVDLVIDELTKTFDQRAQNIDRAAEKAERWLRDTVRGSQNLALAGQPTVDQTAPTILSSKSSDDLQMSPCKLRDW